MAVYGRVKGQVPKNEVGADRSYYISLGHLHCGHCEQFTARINNMKYLSCLVLAAACSLAAAQRAVYNNLNEVPIISYVNDNNYDGSYRYSYETGNGISASEEGFLKNPGQKDLEAQTARGSYTYTAPDGQVITVNWYADETGFHAEGAHLPTPPPAVQPVAPNNFFRGRK